MINFKNLAFLIPVSTVTLSMVALYLKFLWTLRYKANQVIPAFGDDPV